MKILTKNLLAGVGIASVGFMAYTLWDAYMQNEIRKKEKSENHKADREFMKYSGVLL